MNLTFVLTFILFLGLNCPAMDRWQALSQIESGDCDTCIGPDGEVSRFQILPSVWRQYTNLPLRAAKNPFTALNVSKAIMRDRLTTTFGGQKEQVGNWISNERFYLFWHRPGRVMHPKSMEWDRAQRFANLCE